MVPEPIGSATWGEIGETLTTLWIVVMLVVLLAANVLIGHNAIPSLVASGHFSRTWQKARAIFYGLAIISFGSALFFLARVVSLTNGTLRMFWEDFWI